VQNGQFEVLTILLFFEGRVLINFLLYILMLFILCISLICHRQFYQNSSAVDVFKSVQLKRANGDPR